MAASLVLAGCFDDDPSGPDGGEEEEMHPCEGYFTLAETLDANTCAVPSPPGGSVTISIEGDSIWFGAFPGEWNEEERSGGGTSGEYTVPVDPPDCYAYYTVTWAIDYTDEDSFSGTWSASYRKEPECLNPLPCSFLYRIGGTRYTAVAADAPDR